MVANKEIKIKIYPDSRNASKIFAELLVNEINKILYKKKYCLISMPTGNTPIGLFYELIELYKKKKISFKNIFFFNLDEFYPISKNDTHSYNYYLFKKLFNHIDIPKKNINMLNGDINEKDIPRHCLSFEDKIEKLGGLDIQILGIGQNGHIGFNEPGSLIDTKTRKVKISDHSLSIISNEFNNKNKVPREALTMGIKTILSCNKIFLLAWGNNKSTIIEKTIKNKITKNIPATYLKKHKDVTFILDKYSSSKI